jgi:hypothetical protein
LYFFGLLCRLCEEGGDDMPKEAAFFKTSMCRFWLTGVTCPKADACTYAHGFPQLRTYKVTI